MTLVYVLQQLEGARASEVREVSTFQVLDPPSLPTRKARPIGTLAVALGTLLGLAVSLAAEWWRAIGRETLGPRIRAGLARSPEGKGTSTSE
jgi:LPS O-antigen subunit length determinant protein (WzzB/FepE family)